MPHLIPTSAIDKYTAGPSATTTAAVAAFQTAIRDTLGATYDTFLQGSYKNDTAIRDINDVDIVALRRTTVSTVFSTERTIVSITWEEIFRAIEQTLNESARFRGKVRRGDKCIKVEDTWKADVIPAVRIRPSSDDDPIAVYSFREGKERQNWPRDHYANGVAKNKLTSSHYKPTVRMFKNWASNHWPTTNIAPSFYVECLVSNVPDSEFVGDFAQCLLIVGTWIVRNLPVTASTKIWSVARHKDVLGGGEWSFERYSTFHRQLDHSMGLLAKAYQATSSAEALRLWKLIFNE